MGNVKKAQKDFKDFAAMWGWPQTLVPYRQIIY